MRRRPLLTISGAVTDLGLSHPTVSLGVRTLEQLGIVDEVTGRGRDRIYAYQEYLAVLNEGTELPWLDSRELVVPTPAAE
jgi:DNA-binding transcriptional regulator GbsR (MarR family)